VGAARLAPRADRSGRAGRPKTVVARRVDFSIYRHWLSLSGLKYKFGVDRYVAISRAIKNVLEKDGIDGNRIEVVHSGIDLARVAGADGAAVRAELGISEDAPVIGTVAHFAWHKGLEYLVDAARMVADEIEGVKIVLVGTGGLEEAIRQRAAASGADDGIVFAGFRTDIPQCLAMFDVFTMPSLMEGLCTSILDALAARKPVVASRTGGIPEIVENGETGLLVPPGDAAALAGALIRVLREPDLAVRMAERGRRKVREQFSIDAMVAGNIGVYERLLAERR